MILLSSLRVNTTFRSVECFLSVCCWFIYFQQLWPVAFKAQLALGYKLPRQRLYAIKAANSTKCETTIAQNWPSGIPL